MNLGNLHCPSCGAAASSDASQCRYCKSILKTVGCPKCFGMMFMGAKFCPHCGVRAQALEARLATKAECPRCANVLHEVTLGSAMLQDCLTCGGVWISVASFDHICSDHAAQTAATGMNLPPSVAAAKHVRYIKCPVCSKLMNRMNYAGGSGIIIDLCKSHGIWLDREELRHIVEFIKAGGLDRQRKFETEKLKMEREGLSRERAMSQSSGVGSLPGRGSNSGIDGWDVSQAIELAVDLVSGVFCD